MEIACEFAMGRRRWGKDGKEGGIRERECVRFVKAKRSCFSLWCGVG